MQFGDSIWKHARWTRMFQTANDLTTVKCGATLQLDVHLREGFLHVLDVARRIGQ
jgi:hypothetical protein